MRAAHAVLTAPMLCLAILGCDGSQRGPGSRSAFPDSVAAELVSLGEQDQAPRRDLTPERVQDTVFARELAAGDSIRSVRLREIVERHGWPDSSRAGGRAANAAFLVLQHSPDRQFQKEMAPHLEALALTGKAPRADVAMLIDRILMHDGLPQRYGTQFSLVDGRFVMHPVENEDELDLLRHSMELPPMETYMKLMEEYYKTPVGR